MLKLMASGGIPLGLRFRWFSTWRARSGLATLQVVFHLASAPPPPTLHNNTTPYPSRIENLNQIRVGIMGIQAPRLNILNRGRRAVILDEDHKRVGEHCIGGEGGWKEGGRIRKSKTTLDESKMNSKSIHLSRQDKVRKPPAAGTSKVGIMGIPSPPTWKIRYPLTRVRWNSIVPGCVALHRPFG